MTAKKKVNAKFIEVHAHLIMDTSQIVGYFITEGTESKETTHFWKRPTTQEIQFFRLKILTTGACANILVDGKLSALAAFHTLNDHFLESEEASNE